jgi:hypothetical protein
MNTNSGKELFFGSLFGDKRGGRGQKAVEAGEARDLLFEVFFARDFPNLAQKEKPPSKETSFQTNFSYDLFGILADQERRKDLLLVGSGKGVGGLLAPGSK